MDEALDSDVIALVKGKRTKRQRLQSMSKEGDLGIDKALTIIDGSSPSTSSLEYYDREGTITTEEVDMANCLILLAQGHCLKRPSVKLSATANDDQEYGRFTSRKYLETDMGTGKIGYYVYECKTCNRTFRSFQALGGHRASHKKPKLTPNPTVAIPLRDEEGQPGESKKYSSLSLSLPIGNNRTGGNSYGHSNNATNNLRKQGKVHECSICSAEFGSGQALGGHMRRHRAPPMTQQIGISRLVDSATTTTISLNLDLNLPAPEDRNTGNVFVIKQHDMRSPPPALGFSSPAMVDCHY